MTRQEEIRNAIDTIIPIPPSENGRTYEQALMATGFEEGVEWADEHPINVWHDTGEEPQGEYEIIYQDEFNHVWLATYRKNIEQYKNWWEECVACNYIVRWAYISDLLPKGGEK